MVKRILTGRGVTEAELSIAFVGRRMIRRINREYLDHDRVTDVISFDLSGGDGGPLVGDIYICVLQAERQARDYGVSPAEELFRLAAHGVLHLLGYDHETEAGRREMFDLQERLVGEAFHPGLAGRIGAAGRSGVRST